MNREIKTVSEAMYGVYRSPVDIEKLAEAAIAASDSQYVKGLVEALKFYAEDGGWRNSADMGGIAQQALQQLPEDWR